jgi:branched-chain amino acid transport system substrate-binding protein
VDKGFPRQAQLSIFYAAGFRTIFEHLQSAVNKAGAVDATKIAFALEGQKMKDFLGYDTIMRKDDHQIVSEYLVGVFKKGVKYDSRKPVWAGQRRRPSWRADIDQPNTCKMKRPEMPM